ncbi:MAG: tetratricopeptide repeat protein [Deltaproteobacteria bacterium]|nr:tetratricopeptide repeat protein [Deltaproteobacteria bacterium]
MDKKTLKRLKRPDFLQELFFSSVEWVKDRKVVALVIMAAFLSLLGAAGGWHYYSQWQGEKRKAELLTIDQVFAKEAETFALAEKEQRDELATLNADHKASHSQYLEFFQKYTSKPEGWRAGLFAARIFLDERKLTEAADILAKILSHSLGVDFYQVQVRLMYMGVLEDLKLYEEALQEAETLLRIATDEFIPRALLVKGRLQFFSGLKEEAAQTFDLIITSHSATPEARQAQAVKALL